METRTKLNWRATWNWNRGGEGEPPVQIRAANEMTSNTGKTPNMRNMSQKQKQENSLKNCDFSQFIKD